MARRKKNKRKAPAPAQEILSDTWYTNRELWKILKISPSTSKRWRSKGSLLASKRFGKVYFNHTHVQKMLRDGLLEAVALLAPLLEFTDCCSMMAA
jgi:hypothetical protein